MEKPEKSDLSAQNERLRRLLAIARKVRNLSQREIAKRIGQPPSFIGKIENGTRGVSVVEMVQIAKAIGVDPRRILTKSLERMARVSAADRATLAGFSMRSRHVGHLRVDSSCHADLPLSKQRAHGNHLTTGSP